MKRCPFCAEEIQDAAIVCRFCNRDLVSGALPRPSVIGQSATATASPGVAAVLSVFIPGLGQLYKGRMGAGLGWFIAAVTGYLLFIIPGLVVHLVCVADALSSRPTTIPERSPEPVPPPSLPASTSAVTRTLEGESLWRILGYTAVALIVVVGIAVSMASVAQSSNPGGAVPDSNDVPEFKVTPTADGFKIENVTSYNWVYCWVYHRGRRALVPPLTAKSAAILLTKEFTIDRSAPQSDRLSGACEAVGVTRPARLTTN